MTLNRFDNFVAHGHGMSYIQLCKSLFKILPHFQVIGDVLRIRQILTNLIRYFIYVSTDHQFSMKQGI